LIAPCGADAHLELEKRLATFLGTGESIVFSSAYATLSSLVPTFASRGDFVIACARSIRFSPDHFLLTDE
jgi:7-keto-8-aminopelargonate synthetase-like enzyme